MDVPATLAAGNRARTGAGTWLFPPFPPHCTKPLNGFPLGLPAALVSGIKEPATPVTLPSLSIGTIAAAECFEGSKLNEVLLMSRLVGNKLTRSPKFKVSRLETCQSSCKYGSKILYR